MDSIVANRRVIYQGKDIEEIKEIMRHKQQVKRVRSTGLRLATNIVLTVVVLLPLLYAVSVALMPSSELFTTELNLIPKHPTLSNFKDALVKVPLVRFVLNSFLVAGLITIGQIISCSLAAFSFSFLEYKGKNVLFMLQ